MSIATVRSAIADALDGISGLRAAAYMPDTIQPPVAVVMPSTTDYDLVMGRGADTWGYTVEVYVGRNAETAGQKLLDTLREPTGSSSIKTVLEADAVATAAGVDYIRVRNAGTVQVATVGQGEYLTMSFDLEVVY